MPIDTISLRSPYISEELANLIEKQCVVRQALDLKTGELIYSFTSGSLSGSYDNRIMIKIQREEWAVSDSGRGVKIESSPYIDLEGSVHKALLGHNVYGGSSNFRESAFYLVSLVESLLDINLPCVDEWNVVRIDVAEVFELPSYEAVQSFFKGLNASDYPRRSVNRYGLSGIYANGSTTALKFYHKGPELIKHDRSRLRNILKENELFCLIEKAHKILRVEVEIKTRKLKTIYKKLPFVAEIKDSDLINVFNVEVTRFMKEGANEMKIVRDAHDVERRLSETYSDRLAGVLLGTWFKLSTLGEDSVKNSMSARSYYRQIKQLKDAGISWKGTDVVLNNRSLIPEGFTISLADPRRLTGEHPVVTEKLAPIREKISIIDKENSNLRIKGVS